MAILVDSGRRALTAFLKEQPLHLAWGAGSPSWDTDGIPGIALSRSTLVSEYGRASATTVSFAEPDALGVISVPTGTYSLTDTETNHLFMRFDFGIDDEVGATIREVGLFAGTVVLGGLPVGLRYFTPDQLADAGSLIAIEFFPAFTRSTVNRQQFETVMTL